MSGLPPDFLSSTLPYLSPLAHLTRLTFTPEPEPYPARISSLPRALRVLHLSKLWLRDFPPAGLAASVPGLQEAALSGCGVSQAAASALLAAPALTRLSFDRCTLLSPDGLNVSLQQLAWEPSGASRLRALALTACPGLLALPAAVPAAFPGLTSLDLSGNTDLGSGGGSPLQVRVPQEGRWGGGRNRGSGSGKGRGGSSAPRGRAAGQPETRG